MGSPGSPIAFLVGFWLGAPNLALLLRLSLITLHFSLEMISSVDFWTLRRNSVLMVISHRRRLVLDHCHTCLENGRLMVPLPKKSGTKPLGESRLQAVCRFVAFERSLHHKSQFPEFKAVINEYFESGHAEAVPEADLNRPHSVFLFAYARGAPAPRPRSGQFLMLQSSQPIHFVFLVKIFSIFG